MTIWGFIAHRLITLPLSRYDLNNVERNVKPQTIIINSDMAKKQQQQQKNNIVHSVLKFLLYYLL